MNLVVQILPLESKDPLILDIPYNDFLCGQGLIYQSIGLVITEISGLNTQRVKLFAWKECMASNRD